MRGPKGGVLKFFQVIINFKWSRNPKSLAQQVHKVWSRATPYRTL
ncbi:MAG: hypothetical protein EZS28_022491, partial [Streblomastix strix]